MMVMNFAVDDHDEDDVNDEKIFLFFTVQLWSLLVQYS